MLLALVEAGLRRDRLWAEGSSHWMTVELPLQHLLCAQLCTAKVPRIRPISVLGTGVSLWLSAEQRPWPLSPLRPGHAIYKELFLFPSFFYKNFFKMFTKRLMHRITLGQNVPRRRELQDRTEGTWRGAAGQGLASGEGLMVRGSRGGGPVCGETAQGPLLSPQGLQS